MAQTLTLQLFGLPRITIAGEPIHALLANKARALLFYLAVNGQTYTRDALASLLWPETADEQAKRNLRELLFASRKWLDPYLVITRHTIAFNQKTAYWLDVELFRNQLPQSVATPNIPPLLQTIELYQGEFLQGFSVREASGFDEWLTSQRHLFSNMFAQALEALTDQYIAQGDYSAGLQVTQRLLNLEPWRESAHRQQMLLLARNGQRSAALAQYAVCQRILQEEYTAPPAAETVALYERIRLDCLADDIAPTNSIGLPQTSPLATANPNQADWVNWNAIPNLGRFYGRRHELDTLYHWVNQKEQRLIALFGLAGQGKSALVAELVRKLGERKEKAGNPGQAAKGKRPKVQQTTPIRFERILWRSLKETPPLAELVKSWLYTLTGQAWSTLPNYVDAQIDCLIEVLQCQPCLLILDQVEALMQTGRRAGCYRAEFAPYADLFRRMVENEHNSCIILISRERPIDFARLETHASGLQVLPLTGLTIQESRELLHGRGVTSPTEALTQLIWRYSGHPLALLQVATILHELFGGDLTAFLQTQAFIFDELRELLDQQIERLLPLEQELLNHLANERRAITFQEMGSRKLSAMSSRLANAGDSLEAIRSLSRRGMLEHRNEGFTVPALLTTYLATCQPPAISRDASTFSFNLLPSQTTQSLAFVTR